MDHVVLAVQVAQAPPAGKNGLPDWEVSPRGLGVSLSVLYEFRRDRFLVFGPDDCGQLAQRLLVADLVSGHNILRWDLPLLWDADFDGFRAGAAFRQLSSRAGDLIRRVCLGMQGVPDAVSDMHVLWTLDALAQGTLGKRRVGTGVEAGKFLAEGNWPAAVSYALDDCTLVRDLCSFADRYGYLIHGPGNCRVDLRAAAMRSPLRDQDAAPGAPTWWERHNSPGAERTQP